MLVIKPLCPNCHSPNHQRKALCEWCGMSTEEEVSENLVYVPEAESLPTSNVSSNLSIDELSFKKRGEFKSGFLSKANACTFFFYRNRIVVKPAGLNRFFNSADIIIQLGLLSDENLSNLKANQTFIGVLNPFANKEKIENQKQQKIQQEKQKHLINQK